jgi:hypothetical protein
MTLIEILGYLYERFLATDKPITPAPIMQTSET